MTKETELVISQLQDTITAKDKEIAELKDKKGIRCKYHDNPMLYCSDCVNVIYAQGWGRNNRELRRRLAISEILGELFTHNYLENFIDGIINPMVDPWGELGLGSKDITLKEAVANHPFKIEWGKLDVITPDDFFPIESHSDAERYKTDLIKIRGIIDSPNQRRVNQRIAKILESEKI